jgi:hypothetical protein
MTRLARPAYSMVQTPVSRHAVVWQRQPNYNFFLSLRRMLFLTAFRRALAVGSVLKSPSSLPQAYSEQYAQFSAPVLVHLNRTVLACKNSSLLFDNRHSQ